MPHGLRHDEHQGGSHEAANENELGAWQRGTDLLDQRVIGNEKCHGQAHG
jgi:hypothetical protein